MKHIDDRDIALAVTMAQTGLDAQAIIRRMESERARRAGQPVRRSSKANNWKRRILK